MKFILIPRVRKLFSWHRKCHVKFLSDASLANNETDGNRLFRNEVEKVDADVYIQLLCTSPFIGEKYKCGVEKLLNPNNEFDSAVLMKKEKVYEWNLQGPMYDKNIPNSFDLEDKLTEGMGLYVIKSGAAKSLKTRIRWGQSHSYYLEVQ